MDRFVSAVLKTIRREEMIPEGTVVTVGFSGGADSVCLLSVLWELRALLSISVRAVHVNHNLRGDEALRDQKFCEEFCRERGIPFTAVPVDVSGVVKETGLSTEEAARILRYRALRKEASAAGLPEGGRFRIAVAHHADDQAETILLNLLRGTGLKGLSGMAFCRDDIIRPLLGVQKEEITSYIRKRGLPYVTDSTNLTNDYTRNRLRNVILPELYDINENAAKHILRTGKMCEEADAYLRKAAAAWAEGRIFPGEDGKSVTIPRKLLKEEMPVFRRYVIITVLETAGVPLKDWGETHIASIDQALFKGSGHHVDLPRGVKAENAGKTLVLSFS